MPQILNDLEVSEISLVDFPCNSSIDPVTGKKRRHAVVALFKRDDTGDELSTFKKSTNKEYKKMEFTDVIKSAKSRAEVVAAVQAEAASRVKKGGSLADSEARVWARHPEAVERYEALPVPVAKRSQPMIRVTKAETTLDQKSRRVMKLNPGMSYPQACSKVLTESPELYSQYCAEMAAGEVFEVPDQIGKSNGGGEEDCAECSGTGTVGGRVCESCNGFGTVEPDADDEEKTTTAKRELFKKLDQLDDLERRVLRVEAGLKRR